MKVLIVGEPGVGKTSIVARYVHGMFSGHYKSTIGVDFALKSIQWNSKLRIDLQLWDLAGQERLGTQINIYFREAMGALCVYDASRDETKAQVAAWKQHLNEKVSHGSQHVEIPCIMIANKMDLVVPLAEIADNPYSEINAMADQLGFLGGFPTSMKENKGLDPAMKALITEMLVNYRAVQRAIDVNKRIEGLITLDDQEDVQIQRSRGWCRC